jgi:hypothetical protein
LPEKRVGKDGKARKLPSKTRKPPNRVRATIYREGKLGEETVAKLDGTSLGSAREMDELVILNRAAPEGEHTEIVKQLVADAVAGKAVSAIEYSKNEALKSRDDIAPANASDADAALKPSHERAARKLLNHFGQAPGEVQRHFLQLVRNDIGPNSTTEIERQAVEIEELRNAKRRLQIKIEGLESEVEERKAEKSSLSNLIVLLREILAETIDAPWIKPLSTRKRQQAKKLLEQLQGDIYELVKLREVAAKGMPHAAAQ